MKSLLIAALCLVAAAFATPAGGQAAPRAEVGVLVADGDNAFINGTQIRNRTRYRISDGDTVATGPATSVRIKLTARGYKGYIQLDQNTDPNLLVKSGCIAMEMLKGRAIINAKRICLKTPKIQGVTKSLVHLRVDEQADELTVIKGSVDLSVPVSTTVGAYWRYTVGADGRAEPQQIDRAEAERTIEWQRQYFRGMPTWAKWLLAFGGALVLHEVLEDDDDPPSSPPPATPSDAEPTPEPPPVLDSDTTPPETPPVPPIP